MKKIIYSVMLLFVLGTTAQNSDGYWDNVRTTNQTITLSAGKRTIIKTTDLPDGTTEVVFRISLIDDNQKLASSLVSLLKAIPDPTGISQGSAGAVYLLSTLSGDDKCKYAIFTTEKDALNYQQNGSAKNACISQETPINKEAKLLNENSKCMLGNPQNFWIGFESDNWFMKQKIVFELVPWVDNTIRNGWTVEVKKKTVSDILKIELVSNLIKKNEFAGSMLNLILKKYSFKDYQKLLPIEKQKLLDDLSKLALKEIGEEERLVELERKTVENLFANGKKAEAINKLEKIITTNSKSIADYDLLGKFYLLTQQFDKALQVLKKAEKLDNTNLSVKLKLAHAYLFLNEFRQSKELHKQYKNQFISATISWKDQTKTDFAEFEKAGINRNEFSKILKLF